MSSHGSTKTSASALATSLAAPNEEAPDEELAIEASSKGSFDASPMMSITGEPSPSIAQTNKTQSSEKFAAGKAKS
jgi:hypothetical protein